MEIESKLLGDIGLIEFRGDLLGEPADSKEFEKLLSQLLDNDIRMLILNLKEVKRINSTGLAILITASSFLTNRGKAKVILTGCNDFIIGAITVTKLGQFFNIFNSLEEALEELQEVNS